MIQPQLISSRHNPQFKRWSSLLDSQGVKAHQQCLVSGEKILKEMTQSHENALCEILLPQTQRIGEESLAKSTSFVLSKELFQDLDVFGTKQPLAVFTTTSIPHVDLAQPPLGLEILCPIGDPGNLGALLRSCRAFGVRTVILLQEAVHPFHPKVIRASSGAVFAQPLSQSGSITELHSPEILQWISALDMDGENISTISWPKHMRMLVGEEGVGLPSFSFPRRFRIPQIHPSIPLNAMVASSIALHAYRQQHAE